MEFDRRIANDWGDRFQGMVSCGGFIPEQSLDKVVFVAVLQSRIRSLGMEIGDGLMGFVYEILNFIILSSDVALGSCYGKGIVHVGDSWHFIKFFPLEIFSLCSFSNRFLASRLALF